jgi:glycosyltransferase involved in cell wall biosynthesis
MTTRSPVVTMGVPVYNGERYLSACLDSLLAQTFEDFVVIVGDNASTDRTQEIARDYCSRDPRVRYHRNPVNVGCPRNFVKVFELSDTPYFRWAAADDLTAPQMLEQCIAILDGRPEIVQAYPRTLLIDENANVTGMHADDIHAVDDRPSERYIRVTDRIELCNAIYGVIRSDVLRRTAVLGPYIGSDITLQAELALYGRIWEVPEYLFLRRMHPQAQSAMSDEDRAKHYDPTASAPKISSQWRHLLERTRSVLRAPIPLTEKARIVKFLGRNSIRSRDKFSAELIRNLRLSLRRVVVRLGLLVGGWGISALDPWAAGF